MDRLKEKEKQRQNRAWKQISKSNSIRVNKWHKECIEQNYSRNFNETIRSLCSNQIKLKKKKQKKRLELQFFPIYTLIWNCRKNERAVNALFSMQQLPQHKQKLRRREKVPMIASKRSKINNIIVINNEKPMDMDIMYIIYFGCT